MPKVTTLRQLLDEQANTAVQISGAHHSSHNGQTLVTDPKEKVDGQATWNHSIRYNDDRIVENLREMFRNARAHNQGPETLRAYRKAIKTMLHENVHLLAGEGTEFAQGEREYKTAHGRIAEESFTELYSIQKTDEYIDALGLEEIAPGIKAARRHEIYEDYTPGAQAFADTIGKRSGLGGDEVIRRMATVNPAQKFEAAAAAIYDNSDLPGLVPSGRRDAAIKQIAAAMKPEFAKIEDAKATKDPDRRLREIRVAGGAAARAGYDEVRTIRKQWNQPAPQTRQTGPQLQQTQQPAQQPGRQQAQFGQTSPGPGHGGSGADAEVDQAMRAGLGGSRPLGAASRLPADQQGSRRDSGAAAQTQQRPGPENQR